MIIFAQCCGYPLPQSFRLCFISVSFIHHQRSKILSF